MEQNLALRPREYSSIVAVKLEREMTVSAAQAVSVYFRGAKILAGFANKTLP